VTDAELAVSVEPVSVNPVPRVMLLNPPEPLLVSNCEVVPVVAGAYEFVSSVNVPALVIFKKDGEA